MREILFNHRRAFSCENEHLRLTVTREGGHLAEVFDKRAGVSPLWIPKWPSVEPSACTPESHPQFGTGSDARLLAGIVGHNLCLDLFGGPSAQEQTEGFTAHGEASVVPYEVSQDADGLRLHAHLPLARIALTRTLHLVGSLVRVRERVENLSSVDRPIGWTQHVTLGAPFLDPLRTEFRASMTRSLVFEGSFGDDDYLQAGAEFIWPIAPGRGGGNFDLQRMHVAPSSGFTAHLADPAKDHAFFVAFSPPHQLAFGYVWKREDFPWMGIWEENHSRLHSPWNGQELTRGMEFGVSLFPESRSKMVQRGRVFATPAFGWLAARACREVEYWISSQHALETPKSLAWPDPLAQPS